MSRPLFSALPAAQGLYDPSGERDACGVAFVATLSGEPTHTIVEQALTALRNLEHRGASGAEPDSGDGAGILLQVPDAFLRAVCAEQGLALPAAGSYAVGNAFLADDDAVRRRHRRGGSSSSPARRGWSSSAGATCRPRPGCSARRPAR